jgi:hypothetical protein
MSVGTPGTVPQRSCSSEGVVAVSVAVVQPSQLMPESQKTWIASAPARGDPSGSCTGSLLRLAILVYFLPC